VGSKVSIYIVTLGGGLVTHLLWPLLSGVLLFLAVVEAVAGLQWDLQRVLGLLRLPCGGLLCDCFVVGFDLALTLMNWLEGIVRDPRSFTRSA
jgi:hypothetical protein